LVLPWDDSLEVYTLQRECISEKIRLDA